MTQQDTIWQIASGEASCGFACPQCGATDQINILAKVWVRLRPDGSTDPDLDSLEHEWSYESKALCSACGFTATAGAFKQPALAEDPPDG
jgi:predicted RNA-binding Zn-ribbon protein involved in translation (DUF1610 family)